jgi:hypothetical protein
MIRRGFWLTAGALAGIYGYRRACAVGRRISNGRISKGRIPKAGVAAETARFARDVRDGMDLYTARHSAPTGSTLGGRTPGGRTPGGRTPGAQETNPDEQPEDGR